MSEQQVFSDRYEMVNHIARGGMAQVYLARDLLLDRPVALKVLFPELSVDRSFVERFRREAKAAANLTHPNIVGIYDWGQGENTYFIVMEYVDGRTLSSLLKDGRLDAPRAAAIGADVAAALEFAHRRGVIHRDVKPGNVLIDETGQVKVADFGIARAIGAQEDLTQTGSVMGTATYFSPEQAQGLAVDARSDVYSLGVVLYEMVTGKPPFAGDNPVSIAYKHVKETAAPPTQVNQAVPVNFEAIVMKAMAKDPAARYQSAEELRADLVRFSNGQPVLAAVDATRVVSAVGAGAALAGAALAGPDYGEGATAVMGAAGAGAAGAAQGATSVMPATATAGTDPTVWPAGVRPPSGPPPDDSRRRAALWAGLVLLLIALGAAIYFGGKSAGWFSSTKTLTIPASVVGKPASDAKTQLQQLGFSSVSEQNQTSSQVASGSVITTHPAPGTSLKSDQPVVLIVSSGPPKVAVPNVAGLPQDQATAQLQNAGFIVNFTTQNSSTVPQNIVIGTNPPGGHAAAKGSAVQEIVSSGKKQVTIPFLAGQDPVSAGATLNQLGLTVNSTSEPSATIPAGEVTRTDPSANSMVAVGSAVTVYVSTGAQQIQVPDLRGKTEQQANQALTAAGLKGSFSTQPVNKKDQDGKVISQDPGAGTTVAQGTTVNVVIGSFNGSTTTSSTTSTTIAGALGAGGGGGFG